MNSVNADKSARAVVHFADTEWIPSPTKGVERKPLDRVGGEVAIATSLVKYDAKATFPKHSHAGGEEVLVLDGVFSDQLHGDMAKGAYVRHKIGSEHEPWTGEEGCVILVKLRQMTDRTEENVMVQAFPLSAPSAELFSNPRTGERVWMEKWDEGTRERAVGEGGEELFIVDGECEVDGERCTKWSWLRFPAAEAGKALTVTASSTCVVWAKAGHLTDDVLAKLS